jgi:hypothetical protein
MQLWVASSMIRQSAEREQTINTDLRVFISSAFVCPDDGHLTG